MSGLGYRWRYDCEGIGASGGTCENGYLIVKIKAQVGRLVTVGYNLGYNLMC